MNKSTPAASIRQPERSDAARVARRILLEVVTDVPDRTVVARVDRRLRIILPPHHALRGFAFDQHRFAKRQLPRRVAGESAGESLADIVVAATERIADADVAELVDRRAGHPAVEAIGRVRALLE